jgi:hypothetical protein
MNTIGKEYRQIGGDFKVVHHTEYLESLVAEGRLEVEATESSVTYHDPCYLGRHSGVYDAPRNVLKVLTNDFVELERNRENSFCCGAGGAQFWKEEEAGAERISDNRYREAKARLDGHGENKVLAVGCPFCKSMLESTPGKGEGGIAVKDVAELMLESVLRRAGEIVAQIPVESRELAAAVEEPAEVVARAEEPVVETMMNAAIPEMSEIATPVVVRKKWTPKAAGPATGIEAPAEGATSVEEPAVAPKIEPAANAAAAAETPAVVAPAVVRKKWTPKVAGTPVGPIASAPQVAETAAVEPVPEVPADPSSGAGMGDTAALAPVRKKWEPKKSVKAPDSGE